MLWDPHTLQGASQSGGAQWPMLSSPRKIKVVLNLGSVCAKSRPYNEPLALNPIVLGHAFGEQEESPASDQPTF